MSKMKVVLILGLIAVILLHSQKIGVRAVGTDCQYNIYCGGGISNLYKMKLPNTLESNITGKYSYYQGTMIGTAKKRPYQVQGICTVSFANTGSYSGCNDVPYFKIEGCDPPVYRAINNGGSNEFVIPANQTATVTYNTGHYYSWFFVITNQWGIYGTEFQITLFFDKEAPNCPANVRCQGLVNDKFSNGTVTLLWDTPIDNPIDTTGKKYQASGIKGYKITDNDQDLAPGTLITGNSKQITLNQSGEHKIQIFAYDNEGNVSDPVTKYIVVDKTPPTGNFSINNDNQFTANQNVALSVSGLSDGNGVGIAQVGFSNDNLTYDWMEWTQGTTTVNWQLTAEDGVKTVYMKIIDALGNETSNENPIQQTITLDTTPPSGSFTINNDASLTTNPLVTLTLTASDELSGVAWMQFSNDGTNFSALEEFSTSKNWTLSDGEDTKTVYVKLTDTLGNTTTQPITDTIYFDQNPSYTGFTPTRTLQADEEWTSNYTIYGQVIVPANRTLTIRQNRTITVNGPTDSDPNQNGLIIEAGGTLIVESGVSFSTPRSGWMGIIISGTGTISGASISGAQQGVAVLTNASVGVTGSTFSNNFVAIHVYASQPSISGCTFQNNIYGIKEDEGGQPSVTSCSFSNNAIDYYDETLTKTTIQ